MAARLARDNLYYPSREIDASPLEAAAVAEPKPGVDADDEKRLPFLALPCCGGEEPQQFSHGKLPARMPVADEKRDAVPGVALKPSSPREADEYLAQYANSEVVRRGTDARAEFREIFGDRLVRDVSEGVGLWMRSRHPAGEPPAREAR